MSSAVLAVGPETRAHDGPTLNLSPALRSGHYCDWQSWVDFHDMKKWGGWGGAAKVGGEGSMPTRPPRKLYAMAVMEMYFKAAAECVTK